MAETYATNIDGAQIKPDMDDLSTVSETSTTMSQRTVGGTQYRRAGVVMIIAARRIDEPYISADAIHNFLMKCAVCHQYFLRADNEMLSEIFGMTAMSAQR